MEAVKPAHVDHVVRMLGLQHLLQRRLAETEEGGRRRQQHRQGLDVRDRAEVLPQHRVDQPDRLIGALVEVDVRVVMTGEDPVERVGHRLGHVAVQVEHGGDRHRFADKRPHRRGEIALHILQVLDHARSVQVEKDGIDRMRRGDPGEDILPKGFVRVGPDRAGGLGVDDQDRHDLEANRSHARMAPLSVSRSRRIAAPRRWWNAEAGVVSRQ